MLKLKNISAGYGKKTILHNISLSFQPGQIYTILGKNGCGKSTLLKTCADMLSPTQGQILLQEKALTEYPPLERARLISYLAQHRNTPNITVERLLTHGRHPHMSNLKQMRKEDWDVIDQVMEMMDIQGFRHHLLPSLSGGERQRVYLAMLLAQDTPILLLDEPTTYMDIEYQLSFLEMLKKLKAENKTILMVLHDINHALRISDQIILMDQGQIVSCKTPQETIDEKKLQQVFQIAIQAYGKENASFFHIDLLKPTNNGPAEH